MNGNQIISLIILPVAINQCLEYVLNKDHIEHTLIHVHVCNSLTLACRPRNKPY